MNLHYLFRCLPLLLTLALLPAASMSTGCGGRSTLDDFAGIRPPLIPDFDGKGSDADGGDIDGSSAADVVFTGAACEEAEDCDGGDDVECLVRTDLGIASLELPGGYCAVTDCNSDADCGKDAQCLSVLGDAFCALDCSENEDCREEEGYACASLDSSGSTDTFCLPDESAVDDNGGGLNNLLCGLICQDPDDVDACVEAMDAGDDPPDSCGGGGGGDSGGTTFGGNGGTNFGTN
jgi:hypothetical protein